MPENEISTPLLQWRSLDSRPHNRSARWYMVGGILVLCLAAYGLFDRSWTTTLLALLIGGIYFMLRNVKPKMQDIRITGLGIRVGENFTTWNMCKDFWILLPTMRDGTLPANEHPELHIAPQGFRQQEIVVFIQDIDPGDVREALLSFLPERAGMGERFLDTVARFLKL